MDLNRTGELLKRLRRESGMTQREAAERLQISDRTVSKWERGAGLPDVSLLPAVAALYGVDAERLLAGELEEKGAETGNMKRMKFMRCSHCGNLFWSTGGGEISCCGRKLAPMQAQAADAAHAARVEEIDGAYYLTFDHEMTKEHSLAFVALVSWDRATVVRLYPEQAAEVRLPRERRGEIYFCCTAHGLFRQRL